LNQANVLSLVTDEFRRRTGVLVAALPRRRVLFGTTFAFLMSFVVWFDMAPFLTPIGESLHLTGKQLAALTLCNLVLCVPGRLLIGKAVDRFGPRRIYAGLMVFSFVPNTIFATAHSFTALAVSRLFVGLVGAGFVVGIRLVAEWFDDRDMGTAAGFYGGWGNFGSAAAAISLPVIATFLAHGPGSWRWGVFTAGAVAAAYGIVLLALVRDAPDGHAYRRPAHTGALEATSRSGFVGLVALLVPIAGVLVLVVDRLHRTKVLSSGIAIVCVIGIVYFLVHQVVRAVGANRRAIANAYAPEERFPMRSVVLLCLAYAVTFGTELTVISLLPTYFASTFGLHIAAAGIAGSMFAFTNLVTRPGGGIVSDVFGKRRGTLIWLLLGVAASFAVMAKMNPRWSVVAGIALVALASVFVQGGNGAVFAIVPAISHRSTGQIAGMVGAYGNIGGLILSSILYFTISPTHKIGDVPLVFLMIAGSALVMAILCRLLPNDDPVVLEEEAMSVLADAELAVHAGAGVR
jgi:NNP family nitrate/nitrite transporter-like MFS transporter